MSHEIRTPLNAILGFAEILGRQVADTGLQQHVVEIQRGGQRLLGLINDILDMSKAESGQLELEPRVMSTTAVFLDMQEVFAQRMAEKGLDFQVDVQGDLPPVIELDETRLRQVLVNFLDNAVKFTEAGFVRLSLAGEFGSEPGAEMQLTFAIADSGKGIALDQQERIFSAFVQQDGQSINEYGGTGLGLAMNRRLVEMMGGTLSVESEVGRGSTFTVVLPHVPVASGDLPGAAAEADALQAADAPSAGPPDESVAGDEAQDEIDLTRLPELCEALMTERSHWEQVWETQTINEVEELATRLAALGNEYGYSPLREWAVQLQAQAQAFDMASLPGTLGGFPEIVADAVARKAAVSEAHPG